jgi:hypothetical protein
MAVILVWGGALYVVFRITKDHALDVSTKSKLVAWTIGIGLVGTFAIGFASRKYLIFQPMYVREIREFVTAVESDIYRQSRFKCVLLEYNLKKPLVVVKGEVANHGDLELLKKVVSCHDIPAGGINWRVVVSGPDLGVDRSSNQGASGP